MPEFLNQNSRQEFWKISFPQDERGGENHDLLHENSIRKYEDDSIFCMIYNFSKCDGFPHKKVIEILPLHSGIIVVLSNK